MSERREAGIPPNSERGPNGPAAKPPRVESMASVRTRKALDNAAPDLVIAAAEKQAAIQGSRVVIAVVDASGNLLQLRRTDGAQVASSQVALDKARTAAIFVRPSREIEAQVS